MTDRELVERAMAMLERSYCPYSYFPVGAALLCDDGSVFTGCNVENAAYGAGICAERTAVVKAVSEGQRSFVKLAVAGRGQEYCVPCGECRQVLREFAPELELLCANGAGEWVSLTLPELLPHSFGPEFLNK
jgi:cytidine deaminase